MKSFQLESAEYQGKRYSRCTVSIDEDSSHAELLQSKGLGRKKLVSVGKLPYDDTTEVLTDGRSIRAGSWTIVASSEADVAQLRTLLLRPKEARAKLRQEMLNLEKSVSSFLKLREEGIQFLSKLLVNPREVSFSLSASWTSLSMGPLEEFLTNQAMNRSSALLEVNSSVAALVGKVSEEWVERVYAFIYAAAILQDNVLTGGETRGSAEEMLGELGVGIPSEADRQDTSTRLVQIAHPVLFSGESASPPKS